MMKKLLLSLLLVSSTAFGALSDVDKAQAGATNILTNPGFENGKASWTASGGTLAVATSGSNLLLGKSSVTWDSTAASQTLTSDYVTISNGLKGTNGEYGCKIMVPSGTAAHSLQVYSGSTVLGSLSIADLGTNPKPFTGIFTIPTSGSLALRVFSTASNEPSITIDDCYLGPTRSIGSVQVITDWKTCSNVGAGTLWTSTGTSPVYGTSASANGYQGIKCFWRRVGENAEIQFDYHQTTAGTNPSAIGFFNINAVDPGLVIDQNKVKANQNTTVGTFASADSGQPAGFMATSAGYIHNLHAVLHGSLGTQIKLHASYTGATQGGNILGNTASWFDQTEMSMGLRMTWPILGWTSTANAVRSDQTDFPLTNYGTISFSAVTTPPTKGANAIDKVEVERKGQFAHIIYTYQQTGAGSAGSGAYLLGMPGGLVIDTAITGTTATASNTTSSLEASRVVGEGYIGLNSSSNGPIHCYVYNSTRFACTAYASLTTIDYFGSGLYAFNNATPGFRVQIKVPIVGWTETQKAPVLIGGITNGGQGALRMESALVTAGGVVTELNGSDWLNGSCSVATSTFTCTFNGGMFSSAPHCQVTIDNSGGGDEKVTTSGTTAVVALTNPGVGNIAYPFTLTCLGVR